MVELHKFYRDDPRINILHSAKDLHDISYIFVKYGQNSVVFINVNKNHSLYGCHGNKYDTRALIFAQNLEDIFGVIHQHIRDGIP